MQTFCATTYLRNSSVMNLEKNRKILWFSSYPSPCSVWTELAPCTRSANKQMHSRELNNTNVAERAYVYCERIFKLISFSLSLEFVLKLIEMFVFIITICPYFSQFYDSCMIFNKSCPHKRIMAISLRQVIKGMFDLFICLRYISKFLSIP